MPITAQNANAGEFSRLVYVHVHALTKLDKLFTSQSDKMRAKCFDHSSGHPQWLCRGTTQTHTIYKSKTEIDGQMNTNGCEGNRAHAQIIQHHIMINE